MDELEKKKLKEFENRRIKEKEQKQGDPFKELSNDVNKLGPRIDNIAKIMENLKKLYKTSVEKTSAKKINKFLTNNIM